MRQLPVPCVHTCVLHHESILFLGFPGYLFCAPSPRDEGFSTRRFLRNLIWS